MTWMAVLQIRDAEDGEADKALIKSAARRGDYDA
jgi:hypothetical protein